MSSARTILALAWDSPWRTRRNLYRILTGPFVRVWLRFLGVHTGAESRYFGFPLVQRYRGSSIVLGRGVDLRSSRKSNVLGLSHRVILTTLSADARIRIGNCVGISGASICALTDISIGDGSVIGADVLITDNDHHPLSGARPRFSNHRVASLPIRIGTNVFVGARAIILKGSTIGDDAVIGAGAVVSGTIPPRCIAAGNPASIVGGIADPKTVEGDPVQS